MQEKNSIIDKIKIIYPQISDKRKEVNELMVKSKLVNEEETTNQKENPDETMNELPAPFNIDADETVAKLNDILKTTSIKSKLDKAVKNSTRNDDTSTQNKIPTTKNAFNLRMKGALPTSDNEDDYNTRKSQNKKPGKSTNKKFEKDDDEISIKNESESKPLNYRRNNF